MWNAQSPSLCYIRMETASWDKAEFSKLVPRGGGEYSRKEQYVLYLFLSAYTHIHRQTQNQRTIRLSPAFCLSCEEVGTASTYLLPSTS